MQLGNDFAYPVLLSLKGRLCVVVGGGQVAARKLRSLCEAGAQAVVVSPHFSDELLSVAEEFSCKRIEAAYKKEYLQGAFAVVAATDDVSVNRAVTAAAPFLCNNITEPELSNFTVPSSFRQGSMIVALSTGGMPAFTRVLKAHLQKFLRPEYSAFNEFLLEARSVVKKKLLSPRERTLFWRRTLTEEMLELLDRGALAEAENIIQSEIDKISV